jgi:hypothetical protein
MGVVVMVVGVVVVVVALMPVLVVMPVPVPMSVIRVVVLISAIKAQEQRRWHLPALHRNHRHPLAGQASDLGAQALDLIAVEAIGPAEQHQIRRLKLILKQILDVTEVIEVWIR